MNKQADEAISGSRNLLLRDFAGDRICEKGAEWHTGKAGLRGVMSI